MGILDKIFGRKEIKDPLSLVKDEKDRLILNTIQHGNRIEFRYEPLGPGEPRLAVGFYDKIRSKYLIVGRELQSCHKKNDVLEPRAYELDKISKIKNYSDERFNRQF